MGFPGVSLPSLSLLLSTNNNNNNIGHCYRDFIKSIFRQHYLDTLFFERDPPFSPAASWVTVYQQGKLHITLTLKHEARGDVRLLRGELFAIMAAISSRISFKHFERHAVVPVYTNSLLFLTILLPNQHCLDKTGHGPFLHGPHSWKNPTGLP